MKCEVKDKERTAEGGRGGESEGEKRNEIPAERREKNSESGRCRKDSSKPFSLRVYCSDGALVFGLVADVCGFALKGLRAFRSTHILM